MNRIKELRKKRNMTQTQLAEAINTSQRNIERWENEKNDITSFFILKLADFFECSIDYLVGHNNFSNALNNKERKNNTVNTFSITSKELRRRCNLTQIELAEKLCISKACISMIEIGRNEPTAKTLIAYADFFGCSIDYLLGRKDDFATEKLIQTEFSGNASKTHPTIQFELFTQCADEEKMLLVFRRLSKQDKAFFMRFVDIFAVTLQSSDKKA